MKSRAFEMSLTIDAPADAVWRALTDGDEIRRWFSTNASIEPRPGGRYEISWDGDWTWTMEIADWEPPRRLRLVDRTARPFDLEGQPQAAQVAVEVMLEFMLEARGGQTTLRLVHSGFGSGAAWDDEIDGISHGWPVELRILRHYLERQRGRDRRHAWARVASDTPAPRLWDILMSPDGLITSGSIAGAQGGDRVHLTLATGDTIDGRVIAASPGHHLAIAAENLGGAVLDFQVHEVGGRAMAGVVLSSWSAGEDDAKAFRDRAQTALEEMAGSLSTTA
jgi:uncharacterized protein YndB with AHSA1/START domain